MTRHERRDRRTLGATLSEALSGRTVGEWIDALIAIPWAVQRVADAVARIEERQMELIAVTSASADALADLNDAVSGEITAVAETVAGYERQVATLVDQLGATEAQKAQLDQDLAGQIRTVADRVRTIVNESPATPDPGTTDPGTGTDTGTGTDAGTGTDTGTDTGTTDPVVDDGTTTVDDGTTTVDDGTTTDDTRFRDV